MDLIKKGFFIQYFPARLARPFLSLQKVLMMLHLHEIFQSPSVGNIMRNSFFIALVMGMCTSQLKALARQPRWMVFDSRYLKALQLPLPQHLAKNERDVIHLHVVPAWSVEGVLYPLCPVNNLQVYMKLHSRCPQTVFVCVVQLPGTLLYTAYCHMPC